MQTIAEFCLMLTFVTLTWGQGCRPYRSFLGHTMCVYKEKSCPGYQMLAHGLSQAQKYELVHEHNILRRAVASGQVGNQPPAAYMPDLKWDEELAVIAQRAADQCSFRHDRMRNVARFKVGQNIYESNRSPVDPDKTPDLQSPVRAWFNEVFTPGFSPSHISPFRFDLSTGHYTQMLWADTHSIGCGYVMYLDSKGWSHKLYVCNYGPAGNIIGGTMYQVK